MSFDFRSQLRKKKKPPWGGAENGEIIKERACYLPSPHEIMVCQKKKDLCEMH